MSYDSFYTKVKNSLETYKIEVLGIQEDGLWRGKPYGHILPKQLIKSNFLDGIPLPPEEMNLHTDAHHLNSSQVLCYNFFRPYSDEHDLHMPKENLFILLNHFGIKIEYESNAFCAFEYEQEGDWKGEENNFDFYLKSGNKQCFFEIKYTENGFGHFQIEKSSNTRKKKNSDIYYPKIQSSPVLNDSFKTGIITTPNLLASNYQIIRNIIRVQDNNCYVVFITDKNNPYTASQLNSFKIKYIKKEWSENILLITWQDLIFNAKSIAPTRTIQELDKKYFSYL